MIPNPLSKYYITEEFKNVSVSAIQQRLKDIAEENGIYWENIPDIKGSVKLQKVDGLCFINKTLLEARDCLEQIAWHYVKMLQTERKKPTKIDRLKCFMGMHSFFWLPYGIECRYCGYHIPSEH